MDIPKQPASYYYKREIEYWSNILAKKKSLKISSGYIDMTDQ